MKSSKLLPFFILFVFLVGLFAIPVGASDGSYKSWGQGDSPWGSRSIASNGIGQSMAQKGCLVTAIAKVLVHAGQQNPENFTPGNCLDALFQYNLQNSKGERTGNFNAGFLSQYAPELTYDESKSHSAWNQSTAVAEISSRIQNNYYSIICVMSKSSGKWHWMAVDRVENGDIYVMDNGGVVPLYGTSKYSGGMTDQFYFKYSGSKAYPAYSSGSTSGASTLAIFPTQFPIGALMPGAPFYFRGSITSNYAITAATVQVLYQGGGVAQERTVYPNKTTVDFLRDGLDELKFGQLAVGAYIMRLAATDSSGKTTEWSGAFTIGTPGSSLSIAVTQGPTGALMPGAPFYFRGSITSNYPVISATVQVLYKKGGVAQERTVYPNKTTVDFLRDGLDELKFGQLAVDSYIMYLAATDNSGQTAEWSSDFTVGTPQSETPPVPAPIPTPEVADAKNLDEIFPTKRTWTSGQFDDVTSGQWYYQNVRGVYMRELMNGSGTSTFSPEKTMTVAETIVLASRIHAAYYEKSIPRYDSGNWYDGNLDYALINGIPATGMALNANVKREQFVHILSAALPEETLAPIQDSIPFLDGFSITYQDDIDLLSRAGIINGVARNGQVFFQPGNTITRAEAAAVITRMVVPNMRIAG